MVYFCEAKVSIKNTSNEAWMIFECESGKKCSMTADLSMNQTCMASCVNKLRKFKEAPGIILSSYPISRKYDKKQVSLLHEIAQTIQKNAAEIHPNNDDTQWKEFFSHVFSDNDPVGLLYYDPFAAYNEIIHKEKESSSFTNIGTAKKELIHLTKIRKNLESTQLIKAFKARYKGLKYLNRGEIYSHLFPPKFIMGRNRRVVARSMESMELADRYIVDPFEVKILYSPSNPSEPLYQVRPLVDKVFWNIYRKIASIIKSTSGDLYELKDEYSLRELIDLRTEAALNILENKFPEAMEQAKHLTKLSAFKSLQILRIMPFLLDDDVEEFFLDDPDGFIYLDHRKWGRCLTRTQLAPKEICALETRLRSENGLRLDPSNPSLKTEIITRDFQARFSVDTYPLAYDKFCVDVRKLRKKYFTVPELIMNETLTPDLAAYLLFCLLRRRNITVIGEPGAGKTTLINALDLLTPSEWRKISIEDVIESIPQQSFGKHQVRLNVEPFESLEAMKRSKSKEIIKLLHRAPDWIYLGEIQTAEHSKAMFHALSSGLKGFQTCHAFSPEQAIMRWIIHHKIPPICMFDLDIIVHVKKLCLTGRNVRKVVKVSEVAPLKHKENSKFIHTSISTIELKDIFAWNPRSSLLDVKTNLFETPVMQKIRELENIDEDAFWNEVTAYKSIFSELATKRIFSTESIVDIFDSIYSAKVMQQRLGEINWQTIVNKIFKRINE